MSTTATELEMLRTKLAETAKVPKKKHNFPMTSNQEIGWDMDTDSQHHFRKLGNAKIECAETAYANDYATFHGNIGPFANKQTAEATKK